MEGGGTNLITFTVNRVQYQAEEGMTWGEWVNSEYNTGGILIMGKDVYTGAGIKIKKDNISVLATDILINNMSYIGVSESQ